jgi:hypothetical protein
LRVSLGEAFNAEVRRCDDDRYLIAKDALHYPHGAAPLSAASGSAYDRAGGNLRPFF